MFNVTILGAGKIGSAIAHLLHRSGDYTLQVGDIDTQSLKRLKTSVPVRTFIIDVADETAIVEKLQGQDGVISACPYWLNPLIAGAAAEAGVSYFDLTEDIETTRAVRSIAETAPDSLIFAPQCGLAPGFISILASHLCRRFETLDEVKMRVGVLPQSSSKMMTYNLTWSTDGLINEYCNPCEAILNSRKTETIPLQEEETLSLDGVNYEAFNTSGGLGTLCETLEGQVRTLNYKTVRYPGHRYLMAFLAKELRLSERRELFKEILENSIPITKQDVTIVFCSATGWIDGQLEQISDVRKIYPLKLHGEDLSSIQLTTAAAVCAVLDMYLNGQITQSGFLKQEQVDLEIFLSNRFGNYYVENKDLLSDRTVQIANNTNSDDNNRLPLVAQNNLSN